MCNHFLRQEMTNKCKISVNVDNFICNYKIPDSTRMTKDGGDDGMPELDDISKIGKKVRTRPSQKTISQDHLKRPSRHKPSHKTISQDHHRRPSHKTISQDHHTRPSHKTTKTQDKTISQDHQDTRPSHKTISQHKAISQDHQDSRQDHNRC